MGLGDVHDGAAHAADEDHAALGVARHLDLLFGASAGKKEKTPRVIRRVLTKCLATPVANR